MTTPKRTYTVETIVFDAQTAAQETTMFRIALAALIKAVENAGTHFASPDGLDLHRALVAARALLAKERAS